ncbi:protein brawnin [Aphidius gifuensis]|uniref:protein brawnin n=1 Tax=Aphidius gifuensis TaxID=684658 RepID=UPI001CDD27B6|nr:protein brawnin [Aphidius gifuensis]
MPAGMSTGQYLRFIMATTITMFSGSQLVHVFFKPLDDLNELVEIEFQKRLKLQTTLENVK